METGQEKARGVEYHALSMSHFLSFFWRDAPAALNQRKTEKVRQVLLQGLPRHYTVKCISACIICSVGGLKIAKRPLDMGTWLGMSMKFSTQGLISPLCPKRYLRKVLSRRYSNSMQFCY